MELWQRFTHRARRSILIAHEESVRMGRELIGSEHLLLGLIRLDEGMGVKTLRALDVNPDQLLAELRSTMARRGEEVESREISFTPEAQRVLQTAYATSQEMGDPHIRTGHILLALAREERCTAHDVLARHGVDTRAVRAAVSRPADSSAAEPPAACREALTSDRIPPAVGPYSQAVRAGDFVFCSGVIGLSPKTKELVQSSFEDEVRQVMDNLRALLEDCDSSLDLVVKTTVFLADIAQFPVFNEIYAEYFGDAPPARSTVQVAALPLDARLEVEAIALA